ncbi:MAG: AAA family ATPase [Acidobacteriota bacterium]|nr:AAA family ATPase [Acidobacteriota bacterium]
MKKNSPYGFPIVLHKGRIVSAVYRKPEIPAQGGNPLEEALPPVLTPEQAIKRLAFYPQYQESYRKLPAHIRKLFVQDGMRFFAPMDIHVDLEQRFSSLIRMGYLSRNPLESNYWTKAAANLDSFDPCGSQYGEWDGDASWTASGFNIVGMSGIGKSRSAIRILYLYPQVIKHSSYKNRDFTHLQLVWLKLECPFDGNPRGLCIQFFKAVDNILGTTYHQDYVRDRRLQDELLSDMATVASNHFIGVLVIDEIQRLSLARSGGADKMLNFFVNLINTIGVPVVLIGTYKAMALLSGEFSQMRRGTGQGDLIWDRMSNDEQWKLLLESLWRFQYMKKLCPLTPELSDALYNETQGITDFAVKVYMFAQERAIDTGREKITPAIISSVAKDKLNIPREVLNALKMDNKGILEKFEDVYPVALKNYLAEVPEAPEVIGSINAAPDVQASILQFFRPSTPISAGHPDNPGTNPECAEGPPDTKKGKKAGPKTRQTGDKKQREVRGELPRIITESNSEDRMAAYESLKQAGYICPAREFLP